MKEKYCKSILVITSGLILWILYLCDIEMSRYGIYTIFSYNVHELLSLVPLVCIIITTGWLIFIITKTAKNKNIKLDIFLCILLFVLCGSQIIYINNRYQTRSTTFVSSIKSIEKQEIFIDMEEYDLTLDCPMLVQDLLKTDGTVYSITYEWSKSNPNYGKLCMIQSVN
jgi:hypothetical protein